MLRQKQRISIVIMVGMLAGVAGCGAPASSALPSPSPEEIWWPRVLEQDSATTQKYQNPQTFQADWADSTGKLKITVDASVQIPDRPGYAVAQLAVQSFDQTKLDRIQAAVAPQGAMIYRGDSAPAGVPNDNWFPTKQRSDLETEITHYDTLLSQEDSLLNRLKQTDKELYEKEKDNVQSMIEQDKSWLEQMPKGFCESAVEKMTPITMVDPEAGGSVHYLIDAGKPTKALCYVLQDTSGLCSMAYQNYGLRIYDGRIYEPNENGGRVNQTHEDLAGSKIGYQEAYKQAEALLKTLGVDGRMELANTWGGTSYTIETQDDRPCYYFSFVNGHNGLIDRDVFWAQRHYNAGAAQAETFQEVLTLGIDEEGLVELSWQSPYAVMVVKDNVQIMSFSQLMDQRACSMDWLAAQLGTYEVKDMTSYATVESDRLEVNAVELVYSTIAYQGTSYLVPTWNFYGKWTRKYTDISYSVEPGSTNENNELIKEGPLCCLFSLNAIDGSVVARTNS